MQSGHGGAAGGGPGGGDSGGDDDWSTSRRLQFTRKPEEVRGRPCVWNNALAQVIVTKKKKKKKNQKIFDVDRAFGMMLLCLFVPAPAAPWSEDPFFLLLLFPFLLTRQHGNSEQIILRDACKYYMCVHTVRDAFACVSLSFLRVDPPPRAC